MVQRGCPACPLDTCVSGSHSTCFSTRPQHASLPANMTPVYPVTVLEQWGPRNRPDMCPCLGGALDPLQLPVKKLRAGRRLAHCHPPEQSCSFFSGNPSELAIQTLRQHDTVPTGVLPWPVRSCVNLAYLRSHQRRTIEAISNGT